MPKRKKTWTNWARNQSCTPESIHAPQTEQRIVEIVNEARANGKKVRVVGSGHSWSPLVTGADILISLEKFNRVIRYDREALTVTVQPGMIQRDVAKFAHDLGWTLPNISFIDIQTMGGVVTTTTHACGKNERILADHMIGCRLVKGTGDVIELSKTDEGLSHVKTTLGLLGVITSITIQCIPAVTIKSSRSVVPDDEWINNNEVFLTPILKAMLFDDRSVDRTETKDGKHCKTAATNFNLT